MNNGIGPVGGLAALGVAYWVAYGAAVVAIGAILVAAGAVLALLAISIYAYGAWCGLYRRALASGNRGWIFDLLAAPLFGGFVAIVAYTVLSATGLGSYLNGVEFEQSNSSGMGDWLMTGAWLIPMTVTFFGGLFGTAWAISREKQSLRILAYPGFAFYSVYAALVAWHLANPVDDFSSVAGSFIS